MLRPFSIVIISRILPRNKQRAIDSFCRWFKDLTHEIYMALQYSLEELPFYYSFSLLQLKNQLLQPTVNVSIIWVLKLSGITFSKNIFQKDTNCFFNITNLKRFIFIMTVLGTVGRSSFIGKSHNGIGEKIKVCDFMHSKLFKKTFACQLNTGLGGSMGP
jgi:hypothetical protein